MKETCSECGSCYAYCGCPGGGEIWSDAEDDPDHNEIEEEVDYGPCCVCNGKGPTVRNFLLIEIKTPVPGTGWGCMICNLPADGAIAIVCDSCLEAQRTPISIAYGYPIEKKRCFIDALIEDFKHKDIPHGDENESSFSMPDYYDPHLQTPLYWRHEQSGRLEKAILAYISYASGAPTAPTSQQLLLVTEYLKYWITAPCWQQPENEYWLDRLRARSYSLNTVAEISKEVGGKIHKYVTKI